MSKRFKTQDYFRYKKLGKRWRRPVGLQSKLRLKKGGAGIKPSVGYRTQSIARNKVQGLNAVVVRNAGELLKAGDGIAVIASSVGAKKVNAIYEKSRELGIRILNMKKVRRARLVYTDIDKKRAERKKSREEKKKEQQDAKQETEGQKKEPHDSKQDAVEQKKGHIHEAKQDGGEHKKEHAHKPKQEADEHKKEHHHDAKKKDEGVHRAAKAKRHSAAKGKK